MFDRVTGEPVWLIEEREVPQSDVPGERTSPTQPFPTKPPPFSKQGFTLDDLIDLTPELRARALEVVGEYRIGPIFTPPSLEGTVIMGEGGGANWGGAAFDPESGLLYVRAANYPTVIKLVKAEPGHDDVDYVRTGFRLESADGLPINKPPYAVLTAIDLNAGSHAWQIPLGDSPEMRDHPLLQGVSVPQLGVGEGPSPHGPSGPLVTRGGVVFISGGGSKIYAIDKANGETLWEAELGGGGYGNPMTYRTRSGRQFVVIATGRGVEFGLGWAQGEPTLIAFALPEGS